MRSSIPRLGAVLVSLGLVLAACGGTTSSGSQSGEPSERGTGEVVTIRWFCCLGTGDDGEIQVPVEEAVVDAFNASHPNIKLELEVVDYDSARDAMSVEIAGGNAPDIVGPVGVSGSEAFHGEWLDLTDLIEANNYDLSQFSQGSVEFYNVGGEGQAGLPFAIYPSMLYYHRDAFDEAGLEYPPHAYGEPYVLDGEEVEWNMDTMWKLAERLTVDVNGNDATSPDFDPTKIELVRLRANLPGPPRRRFLLRIRQPGGRRRHDGAAARPLARRLGRSLREDAHRPRDHDRGAARRGGIRQREPLPGQAGRHVADAPVVPVLRLAEKAMKTPIGTSRPCRPTTVRPRRTSTPTPSGSGAIPSTRRRHSRS